ncbi:MAG: tellurium resistance protein, partial [Paracoccaceae bacterium]
VGGLALAAVLVPYAPGLARGLLFGGLVLHGLAALAIIRALIALPPEGRGVNPVWHLTFVGFIVGGLAAVPLGYTALAQGLIWATLPVAVVIWGISLVQLMSRVPPAPLRPLMAIHLAPAALFSTVAGLLGQTTLSLSFAVLALAIMAALLVVGRWILAAGFSALWGAFTFPLVALASALLIRDGVFVWTGIGVLIVALGFVPWVAWRVLKMWPGGQLAAKTNAAEA